MPEREPTRTGPPDEPRDEAQAGAGPSETDAAGGDALDAKMGSSEVEQLRLDLEQVGDRALRAQAELENYRRRVARQMEEERRYANMPLLRDLLPVLDNMRRAIEAAEKSDDAGGLLAGVRMVAKQLEDALERNQCTEIAALGEPFDPHLHEAISQQPSADHPTGTVMMVTQPGFQLHDRVVRPSQVIVSRAVAEKEQE